MRAFVVVGLLLLLTGCAPTPRTAALDNVPCQDAVVDLAAADGILHVEASECRSPTSRALLSERESFAVLGAAAWQAGGPTIDLVSVVVDRSADWSEPRSLSLLADQATEAWGQRPVVDDPFSPRRLRAFATAALWVGCLFGAILLGVACLVALVRAGRRGDVVVVWWFR